MKIFISEIDRQNARSIALKNLAKFFDIPDWNLKSNDELKGIFESEQEPTIVEVNELLDDYFSAYNDWFDFYQKKRVEDNDETQELRNEEKVQLAELIKKREHALQQLQEKFDELQVQNFNRNLFRRDVEGIINHES